MGYQISFLQSVNYENCFNVYVNGVFVDFVLSYNIYWNMFPTKKELIEKYYKSIKRFKYNRKTVEILSKTHKKRIMKRCKTKRFVAKEYSYDAAFTFLKKYSMRHHK